MNIVKLGELLVAKREALFEANIPVRWHLPDFQKQLSVHLLLLGRFDSSVALYCEGCWSFYVYYY